MSETVPASSTAAAAAAPGEPATKDRLLDAAERLFAERGFEGASMRAVTAAAGTSVSAANYHFGSKEALLHAALARRIEPLNERRAARLRALEQSGALSVETVVDAYLRPPLELRAERVRGGGEASYHAQLAARLFAEPPEVMGVLRRELFAASRAQFLRAFERALPEMAAADLDLALQLTTGVMVHLLGGFTAAASEPAPVLSATDYEPLLERMVAFASAGIRAIAAVSATRAPMAPGGAR